MDTEKDTELLNVFKYNQDNMNLLSKETKAKIAEMKTYNDEASSFLQESDKKLENTKNLLKAMGIDLTDVEKQMNTYKNTRHNQELTIIEEDNVMVEKSYEDLVKMAGQKGYTSTVIEDLLTPEEIADADSRYEEINKTFSRKTKLQKLDIAFLVLATALQCVRQYVLTPFKERIDDAAGSKSVKDLENRLSKGFFIGYEDILLRGVPYDAIPGSKDFNLGGEGKGMDGYSHRVRTLGHDPILGWVFGTINILTSSLTDWRFKSYLVEPRPDARGYMRQTIVGKVNTGDVFQAAYDQFKKDKKRLAAAIVKQAIHMKSDINTTAGLPLPFISSTLSPDLAEKLSEYGIDAENVLTVGKQAALSAFINTIIAMIHRLFYDENKHGSCELYEVKTRKILLYSNLLASSSNIVVTAFTKDLRKLDVGGLLVTIVRLFSDIKFITKVKDDFINMELDKSLQVEIDRLDNILGELA